MGHKMRLKLFILSALTFFWSVAGLHLTRVVAVTLQDHGPARQQQPAQPEDRPAEQVYKNIQVMKGMPAARLMSAMNRLTQSLGVDCSHCHVPDALDKDDKPAKQTARKMFEMVRMINTTLGANRVCLLYTSPSPRDRQKSRMPSSA